LRHSTTVALLLGVCTSGLTAQQVRGVVRDSASALPIAGVTVLLLDSARNFTEGTVGDDRGRFVLPLAPASALIRFTHPGFRELEVRVAARPGETDVTLDVAMRNLFTRQSKHVAELAGSVANDSSRVPIADATVAIPSLRRSVTTKEDGSFRLVGLAPGVYAVEIRRMGFAPLRDTISLLSGDEEQRRYVLRPVVFRLDTVRTVSPGRAYISPTLRSFEERRARGFGYFIGEDDLRKNDNKSLADILFAKLPGTILTRGPRGGRHLASGRKETQGRVFGSPTKSLNCFVSVYTDGVLSYDYAMEKRPEDAVIRPDFNRLGVREYAGVEFYPGSATLPPGISSVNSDCGVLLLWTRER